MAPSSEPFDKPNNDQILMRETDVAGRWGKSLRTLQRWRYQQTGPAYIRIGGTIFYRRCDILAFEEAARRPGGSA